MAFPKSVSFGILVFVLALYSVSCANGRRGNGEYQLRQLRPTRGFKEMELAAARNFGKRAINMHVVNSILMEWIALESKMKGLDNMQRGRNLSPLESDPVISELPVAADDNPSNSRLLLDE